MRSEKQIQASRTNGARSRGPVTKKGKQRSSQNALRHGLLADCVVLCNESRAGFEETFQQYIDRFQPVDEIEFTFVEEMAVNYWRLRRAWSIETRMFDERIGTMNSGDPMAKVARSMDDLAGAQTLTLLNRYETRIHCAFQRALRNLLMLRGQKVPNEPKDPASAKTSNPGPKHKPDPEPCPEMEQAPEVVQPFEAGAGLPDGVPPTESQPAAHPTSPEPKDSELPNEPKTPLTAQSAIPSADPQRGHQDSSELPNEPKPPAAERSSPGDSSPASEDSPEYEFFTISL
jgi:hypothetical protein